MESSSRNYLRFLWLAFAVIAPIVTMEFFTKERNENLATTYLVVGGLVEILMVSFTISEFFRMRKKETEYEIAQKIKDRDDDIKRWRKEFLDESLKIHDIQLQSFNKTMDFNLRNNIPSQRTNNDHNTSNSEEIEDDSL